MENMISVIVITYNQEDTIARTLESILCQKTSFPIEIVIGEDCSKDNTLKICQSYAERYPEIIHLMANSPNKGVVDNYFDCLLACRGKYIADCAGDDFWIDDHKLEKEVSVLERLDDVGIVHTNWQYFNEITGETCPSPTITCKINTKDVQDINVGEDIVHVVSGTSLLEPILTQTKRPIIHLCTSVYRTEWIRKAYEEYTSFFRTKSYGCEDVQVAFFLSKMGKVAYIDNVTLNYSWGGETVSNSENNERQFIFFKNVGQLDYDLATTFNICTPCVKDFLKFRVYELLMYAFRAKNLMLRDDATNLFDKWNLSPSFRSKIVLCITSNRFTWKLALLLRRFIVSFKH